MEAIDGEPGLIVAYNEDFKLIGLSFAHVS